jgi:hypothetical protein
MPSPEVPSSEFEITEAARLLEEDFDIVMQSIRPTPDVDIGLPSVPITAMMHGARGLALEALLRKHPPEDN